MLGIACLHDSHKTSYKLDCLQLSHLNFPLPALAQRDSTQRGNRLHRGGRKAPLLQMAETVMWIFQWKHDVVLGQIHETKKTCERKNPAANQMQQRRDTKCLAPTVLLKTQEKTHQAKCLAPTSNNTRKTHKAQEILHSPKPLEHLVPVGGFPTRTMPSGIDAALKSLKADAMMPVPTKVRVRKCLSSKLGRWEFSIMLTWENWLVFFCLQSVLIFPFVLVQKSDVCWFLWLVTGEQWLNILVVCLVFFLFFWASGNPTIHSGKSLRFYPKIPWEIPMINTFVWNPWPGTRWTTMVSRPRRRKRLRRPRPPLIPASWALSPGFWTPLVGSNGRRIFFWGVLVWGRKVGPKPQWLRFHDVLCLRASGSWLLRKGPNEDKLIDGNLCFHWHLTGSGCHKLIVCQAAIWQKISRNGIRCNFKNHPCQEIHIWVLDKTCDAAMQLMIGIFQC